MASPGEFVKRFDEPTVLRYAIAPGGEFNNGNTTTGHAARKSLDIDATPAARAHSSADNTRFYIPCIGLISMTSIEACGICKCGWPWNVFAAASCDSASTIA